MLARRLRSASPTPQQLPLLDAIARNGERLIGICQRPAHARRPRLRRRASGSAARVDLAQLVRTTARRRCGRCWSRATSTVDFRVPDAAVTVIGDAGQLERVLINLLSNAVKFTEDGGTIICRLETDDDRGLAGRSPTPASASPRRSRASLFQRFFRSSTAQDRAIQGTGLGLSIVAAIVAAHGGRIDVESAHLEGTTVTVRLPLMRHPGHGQEFTTG